MANRTSLTYIRKIIPSDGMALCALSVKNGHTNVTVEHLSTYKQRGKDEPA